jgi:hypothetical protein
LENVSKKIEKNSQIYTLEKKKSPKLFQFFHRKKWQNCSQKKRILLCTNLNCRPATGNTPITERALKSLLNDKISDLMRKLLKLPSYLRSHNLTAVKLQNFKSCFEPICNVNWFATSMALVEWNTENMTNVEW